MSLLPLMFSNWWEDLEYPHHIPAQNFAMEVRPEQFGPPTTSRTHFYNHPLQAFRNYYGPRTSAIQGKPGLSVVKPDKDKFQVALDIQQFTPDEIKVKVIDNYILVEGKHDEKRDEHGSITRQFIRKYLVPEQCDISKVTSSLSSDGVLTLNAPRKPQPTTAERERIINIEQTGKPAILVATTENKTLDDKEKIDNMEAKKIPEKDTEERKLKDSAVLDETVKNGEQRKGDFGV